jgi:hypothetical protein
MKNMNHTCIVGSTIAAWGTAARTPPFLASYIFDDIVSAMSRLANATTGSPRRNASWDGKLAIIAHRERIILTGDGLWTFDDQVVDDSNERYVCVIKFCGWHPEFGNDVHIDIFTTQVGYNVQ